MNMDVIEEQGSQESCSWGAVSVRPNDAKQSNKNVKARFVQWGAFLNSEAIDMMEQSYSQMDYV